MLDHVHTMSVDDEILARSLARKIFYLFLLLEKDLEDEGPSQESTGVICVREIYPLKHSGNATQFLPKVYKKHIHSLLFVLGIG